MPPALYLRYFMVLCSSTSLLALGVTTLLHLQRKHCNAMHSSELPCTIAQCPVLSSRPPAEIQLDEDGNEVLTCWGETTRTMPGPDDLRCCKAGVLAQLLLLA